MGERLRGAARVARGVDVCRGQGTNGTSKLEAFDWEVGYLTGLEGRITVVHASRCNFSDLT